MNNNIFQEFLFSLFSAIVLFICLACVVHSAYVDYTQTTLKIEKESKLSYDKWFYSNTFIYNGQTIHIDEPIKSVNLQYSSNISGQFDSTGLFYIGHGHAKSTDYYYFYCINDGMYELKKIPTNEVKILETNDVSPCLGAYYDFDYSASKGYDYYHGKYSFTKNNLIIVPINTIITEYKVQ